MNITLETPIDTEQMQNLEKEAEKYANELFTMHYDENIQLAIKHSIITVNELLKLKKCVFLHKVKMILEKM